MNRTLRILLLAALVVVVGLFLLNAFGLVTLFPVRTNTQETGAPSEAGSPSGAGIANPASTHCEEQGYTLEIRTGEDGGQIGYCIFPDGSECEEWAFYRGECSPGSGE